MYNYNSEFINNHIQTCHKMLNIHSEITPHCCLPSTNCNPFDCPFCDTTPRCHGGFKTIHEKAKQFLIGHSVFNNSTKDRDIKNE